MSRLTIFSIKLSYRSCVIKIHKNLNHFLDFNIHEKTPLSISTQQLTSWIVDQRLSNRPFHDRSVVNHIKSLHDFSDWLFESGVNIRGGKRGHRPGPTFFRDAVGLFFERFCIVLLKCSRTTLDPHLISSEERHMFFTIKLKLCVNMPTGAPHNV